jgi:hypothetical protein
MMYYKSETYNYSSKPKDGNGAVHGTRNLVEIKNGKGTKTVESLNASGAVLKRKRVTLKQKEIKNVLGGKFMPGFWRNCAVPGKCATAAARNTRRVRNAA